MVRNQKSAEFPPTPTKKVPMAKESKVEIFNLFYLLLELSKSVILFILSNGRLFWETLCLPVVGRNTKNCFFDVAPNKAHARHCRIMVVVDITIASSAFILCLLYE